MTPAQFPQKIAREAEEYWELSGVDETTDMIRILGIHEDSMIEFLAELQEKYHVIFEIDLCMLYKNADSVSAGLFKFFRHERSFLILNAITIAHSARSSKHSE